MENFKYGMRRKKDSSDVREKIGKPIFFFCGKEGEYESNKGKTCFSCLPEYTAKPDRRKVMIEYFLEAFGDMRVGWAAVAITAIIFLAKIYKKIEEYFSNKAIAEKEKNDRIQEVIDQAKQYPVWHKQSIEIRENLNGLIGDLDKKIDKLQCTSDEGTAYMWRYRILRFDDEIRHDEKHTKEHFDQILEDITKYEKYCAAHPEFPNNKAVFAIKNIKNVYQRCTEEGTFL